MNDKRPNKNLEEGKILTFDHPSTAATKTWKIWKCPTGRSFVVDRVSYINPTGLAGDPTNAFNGDVKNGSTVMAAVFNTDTNDTPAGVTLAADTFVEGTLSATAANTWLAAGDVISFTATLEGTQTLPAGRVVIEGRLV
jgi:hypothetical protein